VQCQRRSWSTFIRWVVRSIYSQEMLTWNSKDAPTNPRGIPYAPFVDKVEDYVVSRAEVDGTMKSFQEMISYALIIQ